MFLLLTLSVEKNASSQSQHTATVPRNQAWCKNQTLAGPNPRPRVSEFANPRAHTKFLAPQANQTKPKQNNSTRVRTQHCPWRSGALMKRGARTKAKWRWMLLPVWAVGLWHGFALWCGPEVPTHPCACRRRHSRPWRGKRGFGQNGGLCSITQEGSKETKDTQRRSRRSLRTREEALAGNSAKHSAKAASNGFSRSFCLLGFLLSKANQGHTKANDAFT